MADYTTMPNLKLDTDVYGTKHRQALIKSRCVMSNGYDTLNSFKFITNRFIDLSNLLTQVVPTPWIIEHYLQDPDKYGFFMFIAFNDYMDKIYVYFSNDNNLSRRAMEELHAVPDELSPMIFKEIVSVRKELIERIIVPRWKSARF